MMNFIECNSFANKTAIMESCEGEIVNCLSYEELKSTTNVIRDFILKNQLGKHICVGLCMTHTIFIPSIVLCLEQLEIAFIFLSNETEDNDLKDLDINWIFSFDNIIRNCTLMDKIMLKKQNEILYLHKTLIPSSSTVDYSNILCAIRTSGTTGESRMVRVEPNCIFDNVNSLSTIFKINHEDVIYFGTSLTFDPSLIELYLALKNGATLLIATHKLDPRMLFQTLFHPKGSDYNGVTILQMVPSLFNRWSDQEIIEIVSKSSLKVLAFGGEQFPRFFIQHFSKYFKNNLRIFNLYGITEVSCWATIHEIRNFDEDIPLGKPIGQTLIKIVEGEAFIGSSSRVCYLNGENKLELPVFRPSGDLVEKIGHNLYYLGRSNETVKRFGIKINLLKIKEKIFKITRLISKCLWLRPDNKLLLFIKITNLESDKNKVNDKIRIKLLHSMNPEEFPDFIDSLHEFPTTTHGKINRKVLETIYYSQIIKNNPDNNPVDVFRSLLRKYLNKITEEKTFLESGANSIQAIQLINEFKEILKTEYPDELTSLLFNKNLKSCIEFLKIYQPNTVLLSTNKSLSITKKRKYVGHYEVKLKIKWKYNMKACVDSSPLIFKYNGEILVAAGSFSHIFVILKGSNGEETCNFVLPDNIEGSACHLDNFLFVGCFDCKLYCLDLATKSIKWTFSTGGLIKSKPIICRNNTAVVVGSYDKTLYCISILSGECLWKVLLDGSLSSNPLRIDELGIYLATNFGTVLAIDENSGSILWTFKCGRPIFGSPCVIQCDAIIWPSVDGFLYCLSAKTGESIWEFSVVGGNIFSSVINYRNHLVFGCLDKNVYVIELSGNEFPRLKFTIGLKSGISSTPFAFKLDDLDLIIAASNSGSISVIDLNVGEILSEIQLPGEIFSSPQVDNSKIFVGCRDDNLYCIDLCVNKVM